MELDVHLERNGDQPWGFNLVGGADFDIPLTIIKITSNSPAGRSGLMNGDTILRLSDRDATQMSRDDASEALADATKRLSLTVVRGLYDPVLDDTEVIYEPLETDDFDQTSQPTEVPFEIQNFEPIPDRSLTASPFVTPTKPFRPFSTEPCDVPPLEDPIILNPEYKDEFAKRELEELLLFYHDEIPLESKFKLPMSEQYDPDGKKINTSEKYETKEELEVKKKTEVSIELQKDIILKEKEELKTRVDASEMGQDITVKENMIETEAVESDKKISEEIDMQSIKSTAKEIVNVIITQAVTVAEEIKKEMDTEYVEYQSEYHSKAIKTAEKQEEETEKIIISQQSENHEQYKNETKEHKIEEVDIKIESEQMSINETESEVAERKQFTAEIIEENELTDTKTEERRMSTKQEIEESIEVGTVKRKSEIFEKATPKKQDTEMKDSVEFTQKSRKESIDTKQKEIKMSTAKLLAEQRAYTIGLETIPHIRGSINSSYHYNLLLKTFFIHLTDVMVALSRFILAEPVSLISEDTKEQKTFKKSEQVYQDQSHKEVRTSQAENFANSSQLKQERAVDTKQKAMAMKEVKKQYETAQKQTTVVTKEEARDETKKEQVQQAIEVSQKSDMLKMASKKQETEEIKIKQEAKSEQVMQTNEVIEKRKLSGVKMAQAVQRKSADLTDKMNAVISEFQSSKEELQVKDELIIPNRRRSRSRSKIEEEVMKESDPLEWLAKVDSHEYQTKHVTETNTEIQAVNKNTEMRKMKASSEYKKAEIRHATRELITPVPVAEDGKIMYVAIVESHVFTNKDAIFEHMSQTSESVTEEISKEQHSYTDVKSAEIVEKAKPVEQTAVSKSISMEECKIEEIEDSVTMKGQAKTLLADTVKPVTESVVLPLEKAESETFITEKAVEAKAIIESSAQSIVGSEVVLVEEVNIQDFGEKIKNEIAKTSVETPVKALAESIVITTEEAKTEDFVKEKIVEKQAKASITIESKEISGLEVVAIEEATVQVYESEKGIQAKTVIEPTVKSVAQATEVYTAEAEQQTFVAESAVNKQANVKIEAAIEEGKCEIIEIETKIADKPKPQDESAELKIVKTEVIDRQPITLIEEVELNIVRNIEVDAKLHKSVNIEKSQYKSSSETTTVLQAQRSNVESKQQINGDVTSPVLPPSPIKDEYFFKLEIPLPKSRETSPVPRDCTPDEEEKVVKKKLVPHIDLTIERYIYDPPLPTPPAGQKLGSPLYKKPGLNGGSIPKRRPFYIKPGLYGGSDKEDLSKEEILEIERKSSLLASAIDETIKSIEEYKEEVGMETIREIKKEFSSKTYEKKVTIQEKYINNDREELGIVKRRESTNGGVEIQEIENGLEEEWNEIEEKVNEVNGIARKLSEEFEEILLNGSKIQNNDTERSNVVENTIEVVDLTNIKENGKTDAKLQQNAIENVNIQVEIKKESADSNNEKVAASQNLELEQKFDPLEVVKPVPFDPEAIMRKKLEETQMGPMQIPTIETPEPKLYKTDSGELIGTNMGIVDGLEEAVVDLEVAKELGKPGLPDEKIAELISGESEMLREAHVMGLTRVLSSHMTRPDDSSVDFQKIKPIVESLKDSEVLKALNEEMMRKKQEKTAEERKWTTFLQKPKRRAPKARFGYYGYIEEKEIVEEEPYKVKIVKQPKPKVAPDYKPQNFETGPLPWEERQLTEPVTVPVEPEEPILIPEEVPEFLEAVDPTPESEVPDLEDTGIPLPPPPLPQLPTEEYTEVELEDTSREEEEIEEKDLEAVVEETDNTVREMEQNNLAEQLTKTVQCMVDPSAPLDEQVTQMRAQIAALAQLPGVIQQTLDLVTRRLADLYQESLQVQSQEDQVQESQEIEEEIVENQEEVIQYDEQDNEQPTIEISEPQEMPEVPQLSEEEIARMKQEEAERLEEERKMEKQKKELLQEKIAQESRQLKQRSPRVGKPKRVFGPPDNEVRPVVLPGGRRWRKPQDAYNEEMIKETLTSQAELIQGKALGINFMKYEKPPVSLDHLQHSDVYKLVHDLDESPRKRVEMLTPVIAEADYRERCRSMTPMDVERFDHSQQLQP